MSNPPSGLDPTPKPAGTRFALGVEYHGGYFHGWQAQPHLDCDTVQETLEQALSRIAAQSIRSVCAGRTDTGVHAVAQVVHFDDPVGRSSKAWVMGTNSQLPDSVRVHWALPVADDFHARFSALRRHYRYVIANTPVRPAHLAGLVTWIRRPLDAEAMHQAGQALLGEQDFSAFRAAACQSNSPFRNVSHLQVRRSGSWVWIDIVANAFLHHMVRNIAGSLIMVGEGHRPGSWIGELLAAGDRTLAADTADGSGLYLVGIDYPEQFALPENPSGPMFLNHPMTTDGGTGLLDCAAGSQE